MDSHGKVRAGAILVMESHGVLQTHSCSQMESYLAVELQVTFLGFVFLLHTFCSDFPTNPKLSSSFYLSCLKNLSVFQ